jgi:hypothetical protein
MPGNSRRASELKVHVEGQLVFNGTFQMLNAALAGFGLAYDPRMSLRRISRRVASSACLRIVALRIRATTSITRADASPHRHSTCWSTRCATGWRELSAES